jgi:pectin methylesterase-like acyl-CoA thioesterase
MGLLSSLAVAAFLVLGAEALSKKDRHACQAPTSNPLEGCPKGTLLVDPAHSSSSKSYKASSGATYATIQSAILSLPHDTSSQTILILPGQYTEQLNVTRPGPLYLLGQTNSPTKLSNAVEVIWRQVRGIMFAPNFHVSKAPMNQIREIRFFSFTFVDSANPIQATGNANSSIDNAYTSTLTIAPTLNSSLTGSGPTGNAVPEDTPFGNTDFRAYNMRFTNDYLPYSAGPSLALSTSYANTGFYYCSFKSYQDTVYVGM